MCDLFFSAFLGGFFLASLWFFGYRHGVVELSEIVLLSYLDFLLLVKRYFPHTLQYPCDLEGGGSKLLRNT